MDTMIEKSTSEALSLRRKRNFFDLDIKRYAKNCIIYNPSTRLLSQLIAQASEQISPIAPIEAVQRVYTHNPETVWAMAHGGWREHITTERIGVMCVLPLNADGHEALFDGRLDTLDPDTRFIARQNERPAAIYHWCVHARPENVGGMALVMERLSSRKFADLPTYCKAASPEAQVLLEGLRFRSGAPHRGRLYAHIMECRPPAPVSEARPSYDTYIPGEGGSKRIGITVARTFDQVSTALALRAIAYIGEQDIPFREDVDGNDFSCTHLLAYRGDEPIGCIRIRYNGAFVKLERLAVRPQYRKSRAAFCLIRGAIDFCRYKGFTRFYGQTAAKVSAIWTHFGFVLRDGPTVQYLTGEQYIEGDLTVDPLPDALTPHSGGHVLVRPEGQWHCPGALEERA